MKMGLYLWAVEIYKYLSMFNKNMIDLVYFRNNRGNFLTKECVCERSILMYLKSDYTIACINPSSLIYIYFIFCILCWIIFILCLQSLFMYSWVRKAQLTLFMKKSSWKTWQTKKLLYNNMFDIFIVEPV